MSGRAWTGAEQAKVRRWYAAGLSVARIAAALGRSPGSVYRKLGKLGVLRPPAACPIFPRDVAAARNALALEVAAARGERATTPAYKVGALEW